MHAIVPGPREPIPLEALPRELNRRRLEAEQDGGILNFRGAFL